MEAIPDLTGRALSPKANVARVEEGRTEGSLMGGSGRKQYCNHLMSSEEGAMSHGRMASVCASWQL